MPYISNNTPYTGRRRANLDPTAGHPAPAETAGELNFQLTKLCDDYVTRKGLTYETRTGLTYETRTGLTYETLNAVIGVLECAKLEFYRRVAAPYEDTKIQQNGEVYATRQE
jgi:hypothetical protein